MYSKILIDEDECPGSWCIGKIILIYKEGPSNDPSNYRPIALSSTISKIFNKILAKHIESVLLENEVIDSSTQKGFLSGINGLYERIFTLSAIIENAKSNGLPINVTSLDLRNAFGSVSHRLIYLVRLPSSLIKYVESAYTSLQGFVQTQY